MADYKKFNELLSAYLAGEATPDEHHQLMQLIKNGSYDELLRRKIDEAFLDGASTNVLGENVSLRLLSNILNAEQQTIELISSKKLIKKQWIWAAAAAVLIAVVMGLWLLPERKKMNEVLAKKENKVLQPVIGDKGKKYIHLQDGSTVLLNKGSRLEYPDTFGKNTREVSLSGEGYFDIQHESGRPFIVHTGNVSTIVLGTAFNIKAYPNQKEITVTVTRGKVKVSDDQKTIGVITPNQSIAVNTENKSFRQQPVNAEEVVEWKKQYLVLDNISLGDAAILIDKRYHVNISFSREALKDCRISATFLDNENLEQVLTVVAGVVNAHYTTQPNDQVIISGEGCN